MVVQGSDDFVVGRRVEHFLHLLKEGLAIELSGRDKGVLTEQDVLAAQRRVEVLVEQVERALVAALKNDLDCILQVDGHFVGLEVLLRALIEPILGR